MVSVDNKIVIVDISGKVELYDDALVNALRQFEYTTKIVLLRSGKGLLTLVPRKLKNTENIFKRLLKVVEGLLNYAFVVIVCIFQHVDVLHFQWLPFLEINCWEIPFLWMIKHMSPNTKIVLTIHNVFPHNKSENGKNAYRSRFKKACAFIDEFIVHTNISKEDVINEFGLDPNHVHVCCHGMFIPDGVTPKETNRIDDKLHILQFGNQSYYKGTDVLVDAICKLDKNQSEKVETKIIGAISQSFLSELKKRDVFNRIDWTPYFLDSKDLHNAINNCDLIVLPYRAISQSGVLLLSIYFGKLIICSNLPSFVETMRGNEGDALDKDLFFENGNPDSLRNLFVRYIHGDINEDIIKNRIKKLQKLYSWESAARATIVYKK